MLHDGFVEIHLEAPDTPEGPKPTMLCLMDELRQPLLRSGVTVVSYVVHWELLRGLGTPAPSNEAEASKPVGRWLLASPSPSVIGQGYMGLIATDARNTVPQVLDEIATDPDVDPARIGVVGFSTNGFKALLAAASNARIKVAVAIGACGDLHRFLHESPLAMDGKPLDLDPDYDSWLRDIEPVGHPFRLVHAAVLMVNGRGDHAVPIGCAETTARALRRAYAAVRTPERFRFVVHDEGHEFGPRLRRKVLDWVRRWLGPS